MQLVDQIHNVARSEEPASIAFARAGMLLEGTVEMAKPAQHVCDMLKSTPGRQMSKRQPRAPSPSNIILIGLHLQRTDTSSPG